MKTLVQIMAASAIGLCIAGCSSSYERSADKELKESAEAPSAATPATADITKDSSRKFIRTSDMKFRVKDVAQATYTIEEVTRSMNGFVTYTHLESTVDEQKTIQISRDSALETVHYTVVNNMTLRVPNNRLDSTLKAIASLVDYLDYRTIKAEDVALQIKANQKARSRATGTSQRVRNAIDTRGRKLNETTNAEDLAADRQKEADDAEIANLSLADQVSYSTVSLALYQRAEAKHWMVPGEDNLDNYRPGLGLRLWESLKSGWRIVGDLLVFFTRFWLLAVMGLAGYLLYRTLRPRKLSLKPGS